MNENNASNLASSLTMASHLVSVIQSSLLETSSNTLQKTSSSSMSSLNAISSSNPTGSSSAIATILSSATSRVYGSTMYAFTSSYALASSVTRTDAQTSSSKFPSISAKHLQVTLCNKKAHNMAVHNSSVGINQTDKSQNVKNESSILVPFTSHLVTPNIQFVKNIPPLIPLGNIYFLCL